MKRCALIPLLSCAMLLATPVVAASETVAQILERHGQHGTVSSRIALRELLAADDRPGPQAPVALQSGFHFEVGVHAAIAQRLDLAMTSRRVLERLAAGGQCEPCAAQALLVQGATAGRNRDAAVARVVLTKLAGQMPRDPYTRMRAFSYRALALLSMGDFDGSLQAALETDALAEKLGRPSDRVRAMNRMLLANLGRQDFDRAEALGREAYTIAERIGDIEQMGYVRSNQGLILARRGDIRGQLQALQDVLRMTQSHPQLLEVQMVTEVNLADYHLTQKHFARALLHAKAGEKLAREVNDPVAVAVAMQNQALALGGSGQHEQGIALLKQAIEMGAKAGAKEYVANMHASLAELYEHSGRLKEALATANRYHELSIALIQSQREVAVLELQEKYSTERKSRQIERLSLDNARKQAEVDARAWQQRLWAALAVGLLLAATLLVQWLRRARERNRALEVDNAVLSEQSSQDPLTGAFNRRHCQRLMGLQEATLRSRSRDHQACVGLVLLDVDYFKQVNDTYGHAAGDAVLVEVVERLQGLLRETDAVVRWGGEEFVLVLPGTPAEALPTVAHRALDVIGSTPLVAGEASIPITASAGCVTWPGFAGQHWEDAMHIADLALYLSKSRGRNRATCLTSIADTACFDRVRSDLAQAEVAGDVTMTTLVGPAQAARLAKGAR